jgi:hypothetical protein
MADDRPGVDKDGIPVIDPTKNVLDLVAAAMERQDDLRGETKGLFRALLDGLEKYIDAKFDGHVNWVKAKFEGIAHEFTLVENRRQEQKIDTKTAVDAALSAAEKAVKEQASASEKSIDKSEKAAIDQSKQNTQTFTSQLTSVEKSVGDLKERITTLETRREERIDGRTDARSNVGMIVGVLGAVFGFLMLAAVIIIAVLRGTGG